MASDKLATACVLAATFWAPVAFGAADDADFTFRDAIAAKAGQGVPYMMAELICETRLAVEDGPVGRDLVFIGARDKGAEIWALAGFMIYDLNNLWVGGPVNDDPTAPPTAEWGWVYDRNGDGRIDWLALVDSPRAVVPEGAAPDALPGLLSDPLDLGPGDVAMVEAQTRLAYWHLIDEDHDRRPDALIALPLSTATGWTEGAMRLVLEQGAVTGCQWRSDDDPARRTGCGLRDGGFETTGMEPVLRADVPLPYLTAMFELVTTAASACDFGSEGIEHGP
jgi:hypothetical protein